MRRALLMTSALFVASSLSAALAQDDAAAPEMSSERIVVTAQKKSEDLQKVPISVKALSGQDLDNVQADSLDDIARLVPSLSMTNLQRGGNQVQIRGLGSNVGNVGTVAIYNDGLISATRVGSSGTFSERDTSIQDLERVEVLRGPQGTLYGEGSFGGVINFISKRPTDELEGSLSGTVFSVEEGTSENASIQGVINVPLIEDVLAVRAVGYRYDHDGYIDAVNILPIFFGNPAELVKEDANYERSTGGRVIVRFSPVEELEVIGIYKHDDQDLGISNASSPTLIATYAPGFDPDYSQAVFSGDIGSETLSNDYILEVNADLGIGSFTSITGYSTVDATTASGVVSESRQKSEEARLSSDNEGPFNWIAGFYLRDALRDLDFTGFDFREDRVRTWAIFGQTYWEFAPDWKLTAGLRYEEQIVDVTDQINFLPTVTGEFSSVIPKIALDWQMTDYTLLYASVAKGFRAGGANSDQSLGTDPTYTQTFDPDQIWNYEIGVKTDLIENELTMNAAVFYIDWSDIQIDRPIIAVIPSPGLQFIVTNGEDAHSYGVEADFYWYPTDDLEITFGGSLLEAQFDSGFIIPSTLVPFPLEGQVLPSTPEYTANLSIEQRFPLGGELEAYGRGEYSLRGNSYGDVPNTQVGSDRESGESQIVNLRLGLRDVNWEAQVFATNVFDEYASAYRFAQPADFADVNAIMRPRTVGLNLRVHY